MKRHTRESARRSGGANEDQQPTKSAERATNQAGVPHTPREGGVKDASGILRRARDADSLTSLALRILLPALAAIEWIAARIGRAAGGGEDARLDGIKSLTHTAAANEKEGEFGKVLFGFPLRWERIGKSLTHGFA